MNKILIALELVRLFLEPVHSTSRDDGTTTFHRRNIAVDHQILIDYDASIID